ncbi:MAG: ABC transporter permease subunit [Candidatus Thermoplasmatota archaeon]|nr:ABC transporter permease subunit [Candidatus Thermoplasmatota archaeon]MCL6002145.1 ABC transporter permease subunit [Candidatus Thermoplasmatota archaeon]
MTNSYTGDRREIKWRNLGSRKLKNTIANGLSYLVLGMMVVILVSIFIYIMDSGASHITLTMLITPGNTATGGILNAIVGTWELVGMGLLFSLPPSILGALYVVNGRSNGTLSLIARLFTDVLTSVPSIVIGLFAFIVLVQRLDMGYSLIAGGIALAVMMLPYLMRIIEISFKNIPREQIENAYALGADDIRVASRIYLPQAKVGMFSGILLAVSIAAGETAQLLYSAGWNNNYATGFLHSGVGYLTYVVWNGINYPTTYSHYLAFVSAMILMLSVTGLIAISKYVGRRQ